MRSVISAGLAVLLCAAVTIVPAVADWIPTGAIVTTNSQADYPQVVPDGTGGAFITWRQGGGVNAEEVFLQRLDALGVLSANWPPNGLPVCALPNYQAPARMVPDGFGGAIIVWLDYRVDEALYMQRILADGSIAPGWVLNGIPVSNSPGFEDSPAMIADGAGGAFLVWENSRNAPVSSPDLYAQHMTGAGLVAAGWPSTGIPVCTAVGNQLFPGLVPDGAGGIIVTWTDARTSTSTTYAQHLLADGSIAPGWAVNGVALVPGRYNSTTVPDNAGGFYVTTTTLSPIFAYANLYLHHFTSTGASVAGWPAAGAMVCGAPQFRTSAWIVPDALGGVMLTWTDYRGPVSQIYASRYMANGALAPGWSIDGTRIDPLNSPWGDYQYEPALVADGLGGTYLGWVGDNGSESPGFIQHVTGNAGVAPGWPAAGLRISPTASQTDVSFGPDGQGGVIAAWSEAQGGGRFFGLFAQRYSMDGPVPVQVSLASSEVINSRVSLDWFAGGGALSYAVVSRRSEISGWSELGMVSPDGTGHLRFEDRDIKPSTRYGYRLGYIEDGTMKYTPEAWVDVPALAFALDGLRPNPASGPLSVSFALADASPASLEVMDVSGRRLMEREVGSLGAGSHLVRLDEGRSLAPGIYWLRLRQGARALLTRGAVVR